MRGKENAAGSAPEPPKKAAAKRAVRRRPRSRIVTLCSLILLAAIWCWALAWILAGASWRADLLANLSAQGLIVTLLCTLIWLLSRRRIFFALGLAACLMHGWILCTGRTAIMPRDFDAALRVPGAVRLFHYNASHKRRPEEVFQLLASAAPDIASICEPNVVLQQRIIYADELSDIYPYRLKRFFRQRAADDRVGAGVVLSKWPLESFPITKLVPEAIVEDLIAGIVTVPADALDALGAPVPQRWGIIAIHPRSPRTADRWAHGNEVTTAAAAVAARMQAEGLPVVLLADLNSTPSGWRSRELFSAANLRRAKPLLAPAGTYPTFLELGQYGAWKSAWPATIAIDDAFLSPGLHVRGWTRLDPAGSDHWPIQVEIIPARP